MGIESGTPRTVPRHAPGRRLMVPGMRVQDCMSELTLVVGPSHTLMDVAGKMADRKVGAAVVLDPDHSGIGILTERDIVRAVARGCDPRCNTAADFVSDDVIFAAPDWSLQDAARVMLRRAIRHLIVMDQGDIVGVISMRDIVGSWNRELDESSEQP